MPTLVYVDLRVRSELDRRRQRVAVWVRPDTSGASLFLGDVWRGISNGRWYFTNRPNILRRMGTSDGYRSRDDAAWALFAAQIAIADMHVHDAVTEANALRQVAGEEPLVVSDSSAIS